MITAEDQPPNASFTSSPSSPTTDNTIQFTDSSTDADGTIASWSWSFGDGSASTSQNPTHRYSSADTYTVTLTVTDDDGLTDSQSVSLDVGENYAEILSYSQIISALPDQLPEFTETVVDLSFAGGTQFTHSYDPGANVVRLESEDCVVRLLHDKSEVTTPVISAWGYTDPSSGQNLSLIPVETSNYVYSEVGLGIYRHSGLDPGTGERFEGTKIKIPVVGGGFSYVEGDQGTESVTVETPVSDVLGLYAFGSRKGTDEFTIGEGLTGGIGVASGAIGIGGYWKEDEWGLKIDGSIEVGVVVGSGGANKNTHINLKPIAERSVAAGQYLINGGEWVADKIGDRINAARGLAGDLVDGVEAWLDNVHSPIPPMPEGVRTTMENICGEFTLDLYEILTTTPVSARDQAADLMVMLNEIVQDGDIRSKLAQALSAVEQIENDFADTWRVKSLSLFDNVNEAISSIDEAIVLAENREPEILDNLSEIRDKLIDVEGLLAGDICYDARVAGGSAESITLADQAFASGDYKTAYMYALQSTEGTPTPLALVGGVIAAVVIIAIIGAGAMLYKRRRR